MKPGKEQPFTRQRGMVYVGVLLLVAAVGLGITQGARVWQIVQQREKEAQLLFIGDQFRRAIASYYNSAEGSRYPQALEELLEDRRTPRLQRHLRRIFVDPLTGSKQWGIVQSPEGGIMGVYSKATEQPFKQQGFPEGYEAFAEKNAYREWAFIYLPPTASGVSEQPNKGSGPT